MSGFWIPVIITAPTGVRLAAFQSWAVPSERTVTSLLPRGEYVMPYTCWARLPLWRVALRASSCAVAVERSTSSPSKVAEVMWPPSGERLTTSSGSSRAARDFPLCTVQNRAVLPERMIR